MEPVRRGYSPSLSSDEEAIANQFEAFTFLDGREDSYTLHDFVVLDSHPDESVGSIANDNNAVLDVPESAIRASLERKGVALYAEIVKAPSLAYEKTIRFLRENPRAISITTEGSNNSPLHEVIVGVLDHQPHKYVPLAALLEMGADTSALNSKGQTPLDVALAADSVMLVQLLTSENPTKELLLELALENEIEELVTWLV